jgi:hypothetical protein
MDDFSKILGTAREHEEYARIYLEEGNIVRAHAELSKAVHIISSLRNVVASKLPTPKPVPASNLVAVSLNIPTQQLG